MTTSADTTWRDALILDAPRIAGFRVRPLSAWHCHVAQLFGIRLGWCDDGRGPTPGDVANAIALCQSKYDPDKTGVPYAGRLLRFMLAVRWMFVPWQRDGAALCRYVDAYRRYPATRSNGGKESTPVGAPPYYTVAVNVASKMPSMPLADALNMPLLSLYCLKAILSDLSGDATCAWRTSGSSDDIEAALKAAQDAINRHNAAKGAANA